jgi:PKHD-type hydroxylase
MLIHIGALLKPEQVAAARRALDGAEWVDGRATAGFAGARVKNNREVSGNHPAVRQAGEMILAALSANQQFMATALPLKVTPPMFNRYQGGETYGNHTDGALMKAPDSSLSVRTDLAATVFLSAPQDYDGGELTIEDTYGSHGVKLPAGDMILYPASSIHRVTPVTRGARVGAFFWIQSLVRDDGKRAMLVAFDTATQQLYRAVPDNPGISGLHGVYHNLLRMWAET